MAKHANVNAIAAGSGGSVLVERCQVSGSEDLRSILFLGFLPPVNTMAPIGTRPNEQPAYPAELLYCPESKLVQLGLIVDPAVLFPPHYAYTSGTTKILRENFAELYQEVMQLYPISREDLVVDVGSNDGTLLSNFQQEATESSELNQPIRTRLPSTVVLRPSIRSLGPRQPPR